MPLPRKLNFEVGARTWRFHSDDDIIGGVSKRGGYFETTSRASAIKPKSTTTSTTPSISGRSNPNPDPSLNPAKSATPSIAQPEPPAAVPDSSYDLRLSEELAKIELERQQIAQEKLQIEEMSRQTQIALQHAEQIRQQVAEDGARAAEERRLHQQELEQGKQNMLIEADLTLQRLREEVAAAKEKHRVELLAWQERQERALSLQTEAEARAKEREAAEEARALQRERELVQERAAELDRLKQAAIEEYKRTHDELRRNQEVQLRKELEQARQKIDEETAARKVAFEAEREATLLQLKEEARLEYQKQLDSHLQLGKETAEALKEATAKAAEEFKAQSQEALKSLRSVTADSYQRSEASVSRSASDRKTPSTKPTSSVRSTPHQPQSHPPPTPKPPTPKLPATNQPTPSSPPAKNSSSPSEEEIRQKREAMLQRLMMNVFTPNVSRVQEWGIRSAPPPFPAAGPSPSASWASPAHRARASSVGQVNLSTPFVPGSAVPGHFNSYQVFPMRNATITQSNQDLYSRPSHTLAPNDPYQMQPIPRSSPIPPTRPINTPHQHTWSIAPSKNDDTSGKLNPTKSLAPAQHQHQRAVEKVQPSNIQQHQQPFPAEPQPLKSYSVDMLPITTMTTIPGYDIIAVFGIVYGIALRDSTKEQSERSITLERKQAMTEMWKQAERLGANFVIGLKFQSAPVSLSVTEITAFGTAVTMASSGDMNGTASGSSEHSKQTAVENQGTGQNLIPQTKPNNKPQKGAVAAPEGQNNKNKNKGKRNDQNGSQTHQEKNDDWNNQKKNDDRNNQKKNDDRNNQKKNGDRDNQKTNGGWNVTDTNNGGNDPKTSKRWGNSETNGEWTEWQYPQVDEEDGRQEDLSTDNFNDGYPNWPTDDNAKSQKKKNKDNNTKKQADSSSDVNHGFDNTWNDFDGAGNHETSGQNESQKGKKGKKGNKGEGETPKDKGEGKNGSKVQKNKGQPTAPESSPTSQPQGAPGGAVPKSIEYPPNPNLPLVVSSRPWHPSGPLGNEYDDPRYAYPYPHRNVYEHEYFSRRGVGLEFHPMYPHHSPFDMYGSVPPSRYAPMPRAPMQLQWCNDGNRPNVQPREMGQGQGPDQAQWRPPNNMNQVPSNPNAYPRTDTTSRCPWASNESSPKPHNNDPSRNGSRGDNSAPSNNSSKNNTKGKAANQAPKKGGPPPQDEYTWAAQGDNNYNSSATNHNNTWDTNANEGGKATGKNANKRNNAAEPQRRKNGGPPNQNGKPNGNRKRAPSPEPTPSTTQDDEEEDENSEGGDELGLLSMMSAANHRSLLHHHATSYFPPPLPHPSSSYYSAGERYEDHHRLMARDVGRNPSNDSSSRHHRYGPSSSLVLLHHISEVSSLREREDGHYHQQQQWDTQTRPDRPGPPTRGLDHGNHW